jgi:hypothetical protein
LGKGEVQYLRSAGNRAGLDVIDEFDGVGQKLGCVKDQIEQISALKRLREQEGRRSGGQEDLSISG